MASFTPIASSAPSDEDANSTDDEQATLGGGNAGQGPSPVSTGDAQQRGLTPSGPDGDKPKKKPASKKKTLPVRELTGAQPSNARRCSLTKRSASSCHRAEHCF